jgi:hypothetical protein
MGSILGGNMDGIREIYLLWARLLGAGGIQARLSDIQAGHPIDRCVRRMERVAAAHQGRVLRRDAAGLAAAFETADAAVIAACDMQTRCDDLPPVSGVKLGLRIAIHRGPARQRASDQPGETEQVALQLAQTLPGPGIAISATVHGGLTAKLAPRASPLGDVVPGVTAYAINCVATVPAGTSAIATLPRAIVAPLLILRHGKTELEFGQDHGTVNIGRDQQCDLVVQHDLASRRHFTIERKGDAFVLADSSTNGTYVTPEGEAEFLVKHNRVTLKSRGHITLGHPYRQHPEQAVAFEVLHV